MIMAAPEDITAQEAGDLRQVRAVIDRFVRRQPPEIRGILGPCLSPGGKLLRPRLAFMSARAATGGFLDPVNAGKTALFAAAVELVHNASLVHDDIMDGDLFRRGRRTVVAQYGRSCAVLTGDVLHITVFDLLGRLGDRAALGMMTRAIRDMCYGQLLDVNAAKRTARDYAKIIRCKTGALMAAACAGGAVMSGARLTPAGVRAIGRFGLRAGMLYQMVDDFLDGDAGVALAPEDIGRAAASCRAGLKAFAPSGCRGQLASFIDRMESMAAR